MTVQTSGPALSSWTTRRDEKQRRMQLVQPWMKGPVLSNAKVVEALETLIVSGDRVVLEGMTAVFIPQVAEAIH
jgi:malonate decarboxylase alpha subunit